MSYSINPVVVPDFGATWQRGQQAQQQREQNALLFAQQQREAAQAQQYEGALTDPAITQGMLSEDPRVNRNALAMLAQRGGVRGFQAALPMIQKQQEEARIQAILGGLGVGGGVPATQSPMPPPTQAPPPPATQAPPLPPMSGPMPQPAGDPRARNVQFAALREQVLANPNLTPEQQQAALARISAAQAQASGLSTGVAYRGPSASSGAGQWDAGLPPATGAVGASVAPPAAPQAAPPGAPPRQGMPTLPQVMALIASGNPRLMEMGKAYLPLLTRENNLQTVTQGGQVFLMDPRTGQRTPMGPAEDVREETRVIEGRPVQGQTVNGRFTPYPSTTPPGMIRGEDGRLVAEPGSPQESEARSRGFGATSDLRREFASSEIVKDYRTAAPRVEAIRRAFPINTRAADLDMVYAFANLLDPGSVVKEGEQLMVRRTGGIGDNIVGYINGLNGGAQLTPDVRRDLVAQAESRYSVYTDAYNQHLQYYRGLAQENGYNPEHIGKVAEPGVPRPAGSSPRPGERPAAAPAAPGGMPRVASPAEALRLPSGTRFLGPDGVERIRP